MEANYDSTSIVGRPTLMAIFDGHREAQSILEALRGTGHPLDDVSVLLRPAGTDAVEDLLTGERPAGQSGDARLLSDKGSKTLVLLHPDNEQLEAVRAALTGLGAENIEYEPQTVYTGAQSAADMEAAAGVSAQEVREHLIQDEAQAAEAARAAQAAQAAQAARTAQGASDTSQNDQKDQ
jgi:hypothetical protein